MNALEIAQSLREDARRMFEAADILDPPKHRAPPKTKTMEVDGEVRKVGPGTPYI